MVSGEHDLRISLINPGVLINTLNRRLRACPWYEEFETIQRNLQLPNIRKVNLNGVIETDCPITQTSCLDKWRNRAKAPMTKTRNIHTRAGLARIKAIPYHSQAMPDRITHHDQ